MGSDLVEVNPVHLDLIVSTHAPAWGATQSKRDVRAAPEFQPTLPHGERRMG